MNKKAINESIDFLDRAIEFISGSIDKADDLVGASNKRKFDIGKSSSIARAASGLTLVYPVVCSTALRIDSDSMICKVVEKRAVTMLQILLAANQLTNFENAVDFIRSFHTNLDYDKLTLDNLNNAIGSLVESNNFEYKNPKLIKAVLEDFKYNTDSYYKTDLREVSLNEFTIRNTSYGKEMVLEADAKDKDKTGQDPDKYKNDDPEQEWNYHKSKNDREIEKQNIDIQKHEIDLISNRVVASDIRKANEFNPTLVTVNWINKDDKGNMVRMQSMIGVKAKISPVQPNEVIARLVTKNADSNLLLKLIKATTREISFAKDFLLAIDNAKLDAISKSKRGSATSLFKALERRGLKGKIRKTLKKNDYCKAITTLVISQEEVEQMRKYNNIDIEEPRTIIPIMEKLNLLFFIIVDESSEVVKILTDGDSEYELLSFDALERDTNDNSYKKVINLMTKISK